MEGFLGARDPGPITGPEGRGAAGSLFRIRIARARIMFPYPAVLLPV